MRDLKAPSTEELLRLYKLCGSEAQVTALLAKQHRLTPEALAPTVRKWLAALPEIPPPSRQRSAPPSLVAPAMSTPFATSVAGAAARPAEVVPIRPPPASAPVRSSGADVIAAMRALDSRLNSSALAQHSTKVTPLAPKSQRAVLESGLNFRPNLLPSSVPEHEEALDGVDDEAAAYMARTALGARLEPKGMGGKRDPIASTWMTRRTRYG